MMFGFQILLLAAQILIAAMVCYLLLLTFAATRAKKHTPVHRGQPAHRFLILVPAHNEENLLPGLLESLQALDYPASLYTVHVVADNCTDRTAEVARQGGAVVHERSDLTRRGKGYALQWLLQRLWDAGEPHDAVVVLDADTVVSPNFLRVMDARLASGEEVIQSYYAVRNPDRSWAVSLRYAALAAVHYLRPLGRTVLGGSVGLKGNGMVFAAHVMKEHQWTAHLTEDIEFHMALVLNGKRVTFAPDAVVQAEMPATLSGAQTQNVRWERGRLQMARQYVPQLLKKMFSSLNNRPGRAFLYLDAAMEHVIPPFSMLLALSGVLLSAAILLPAPQVQGLKWANIILGIGILAGEIIYALASLKLAQAPPKIYQALVYAPAFVVWKIWLYFRVLLGLDKQGWVRTARNEP